MAAVTDLNARDEQGRAIGRPYIDAIFQGKRVRAVGTQLVFRPPEETRQEFFVHVLAETLSQTLGDDWTARHDALPVEERHPVALWLDAWDEMRRDRGAKAREVRAEGGGRYSATATGDALALLTLTYDVYMLRHAMALAPGDALVKRLGNRDEFQAPAMRSRSRRSSSGPATGSSGLSTSPGSSLSSSPGGTAARSRSPSRQRAARGRDSSARAASAPIRTR
jgi:hypothetical protein